MSEPQRCRCGSAGHVNCFAERSESDGALVIWCYFDNGARDSTAWYAVRAIKRQIFRIIGTTIPT